MCRQAWRRQSRKRLPTPSPLPTIRSRPAAGTYDAWTLSPRHRFYSAGALSDRLGGCSSDVAAGRLVRRVRHRRAAAASFGMVVAGPMDLFLPESSPLSGIYLWMLMFTLYVLAITLWNLLSRPRLVIFNITSEQLRPVLAELVKRLDEAASSTGDSYLLPQIGLQFPPRAVSALATMSRSWRSASGKVTAVGDDCAPSWPPRWPQSSQPAACRPSPFSRSDW